MWKVQHLTKFSFLASCTWMQIWLSQYKWNHLPIAVSINSATNVTHFGLWFWVYWSKFFFGLHTYDTLMYSTSFSEVHCLLGDFCFYMINISLNWAQINFMHGCPLLETHQIFCWMVTMGFSSAKHITLGSLQQRCHHTDYIRHTILQ